jgi:glycosyltransferase involved in cell wall biosynthesis
MMQTNEVNNNLRVLQIVPTPNWGGGERYVHDLTEAIKANGDNVFVISRKSDVIQKKFADLNLPFFTLPLLFLFDVYSILRLAFFIKKHRINIVHSHIFCDAFLAIFAKKLIRAKSVKVVMTRHLAKRGKNNFLYRYLYKNLDPLIFVSNVVKESFFSTVSTKNIRTMVVHNAVKNVRFESIKQMDYRRIFNVETDAKLLGFCGRLDFEKGVDLIFDALPQLLQHNAVLLVAGVGDKKYMDFLHQKIKDLNIENRVYFLGFVDDVLAFLAALDVAILPSRAKEAFHLVLIECLQVGCPVITTNTGAQEEIIENQKTGLIIPPNSVSEIVEKTKLLLDNPEYCSEVRKNAIKASEAFSYNAFFKTIYDLYIK